MKTKIGLFIFVLVALCTQAKAQDISIVNVRKNIALSNEETSYRDYYLNAGVDGGLKKGQVLQIVRKTTARDSSGAQSYGDMFIPIGEVKVIAVYEKMAVARESKIFSRDELPVIDQVGLMTGDKVDLKGQYSPTAKK